MNPVYLQAPVRAVIYNNDTLIWGEGDLLHIGDEIIRVPGSERIIGLDSGSNDSIFVRTEFKLFKYHNGILILVPLVTRDRILAVLDEGDKLWVVQARGTVQLFTHFSGTFSYSNSFSLSEYSAVFYSASIIRRCDTIEIAYGTIFSGILLAQIERSGIKTIATLEGHRGTIFDIKHHPKDQNILISCSDDRSIRIWTRNTENDIFESSAICNGHEARVWSIDVQGDIVASVSEDNTCKIWDFKGNCIKTIEGDSYSKSIWSVALNSTAEKVTVGSNDGSVIIHNLNNASNLPDLVDYVLPESYGSIKNIIISNEGICYAATDQNKLVKISNDCDAVEIKGINKFPAMALNSKSLFIADEEGTIYVLELKSDGFAVEKFFELKRKITKIHAQDDVLFLETVDNEYFLLYLADLRITEIRIDKKYKITSFCYFEDQILIGTRQGALLVFNSGSLVKTIQLTQQESLKSIKITCDNQISVLDRSGYEIILDICSNFNVLNRNKVSGKGNLECHIGNEFISSFYQQYFIINSPVFGLVDKVFCGGGHRLWSVSSTFKTFHFAFMSNGRLTVRHGSLENVNMISAKSHGKEIRCAHNLKANLILSGSEDGLLMLYDGLNVRNELRLTNTSIKCIASIDDFVFVGGSNETIEAFELNKTFLKHRSSCTKQIKSIETRVLCLDTMKFNDKILILAGYSDASIRLFEYQNDEFILKASAEKVHQKRCIQHIRFISGDSLKFISAGADGLIQFWRFDKEEMFEMLWHCCVHQSGINAIDLKAQGNDKFSVLTGGEDGSISLLKIGNDKIENFETKNVHNSTVTGVKFLQNENDSFVSASIDRYIYKHDSVKRIQYRTVISDISAMAIDSENGHLFVYGAGIEAFKL